MPPNPTPPATATERAALICEAIGAHSFGSADYAAGYQAGCKACAAAIRYAPPYQVQTSRLLTFGQAIEHLKAGRSIKRAGWNGKNMHVYLEEARIAVLPNVKAAGVFRGTSRTYAPHLVLYTAQGVHQIGWNASTPDVLAEDWGVAEHD